MEPYHLTPSARLANTMNTATGAGEVGERLTPLERRIAGVLYDARFGPPMSSSEIADIVYADDPNGGPESDVIRKAISVMRPKIEALGCRIETVWGRGWRLVRA